MGLYFAAHWLQADDEPARSEIMVVLAGGSSRPLYAADLYHEGMADTIYVSRPYVNGGLLMQRDLGFDVPNQEDVYAAILERKDVPLDDVVFFGQGVLSTIEEAEALKEAVGEDGGTILVITSPFHVRRVKIIYHDVFPDREVLVCATPYETFPEKWWTTQSSALAVVSETAKTLFYMLGGGFRSTDVAQSREPVRYTLPETP